MIVAAYRLLRKALSKRPPPEVERLRETHEKVRRDVHRKSEDARAAAERGINDAQVIISTMRRTLSAVEGIRNERESGAHH